MSDLLPIGVIRQSLMDRRVHVVSYETGLHYNTIRNVRDGKNPNPTLSTMRVLTDYIRDKTFQKVEEDALLNTGDASEFLKKIGYKISKSTLSTYRSWNKGPTYQKVGKSIFYKKSDLKQWMIDCTVMSDEGK